MFTTCRCPKEGGRDPWRIRAREADLEIGGYGTVRDATIDVLGVPALWLPWLIVPLRTERQSGFLLPELSAGTRQGFQIGTPFFWAVRENINATFTPSYSIRRGFKQNVQLEYLLGQESEGDLFGAFAYDQEVDPHAENEPFGRTEPFDKERWSVIGSQKFVLPDNWLSRSDFRFVSDNDYPIDYQELRSHRADRWLQSWALLGRNFGESGRLMAEGSARYANDMQSPDDVDRDTTALNRLPELSLAGLPGAIGSIPWLRPSFDASYIQYYATDRPDQEDDGFQDTGTDGVFNPHEAQDFGPANPDPHGDDFIDPDTLLPRGGPEGNGRFDEGEPLTNDGSRIRLNPRLAAPLRARRRVRGLPGDRLGRDVVRHAPRVVRGPRPLHDARRPAHASAPALRECDPHRSSRWSATRTSVRSPSRTTRCSSPARRSRSSASGTSISTR